MQPQVLLFDLGGVLVRNTMFDELPELAPQLVRPGEAHEGWLSSPLVRAWERGEIESDRFADQFIAEMGLAMPREAFLGRISGWVKGFYPGAAELLVKLKTRYRIAYLSNSNALHWRALETVLAHADLAIASHLCGLAKPQPEIFAYAVEKLGVEASAISFFDDSSANVEAARRCGLQAHYTVGFEALVETIDRIGL